MVHRFGSWGYCNFVVHKIPHRHLVGNRDCTLDTVAHRYYFNRYKIKHRKYNLQEYNCRHRDGTQRTRCQCSSRSLYRTLSMLRTRGRSSNNQRKLSSSIASHSSVRRFPNRSSRLSRFRTQHRLTPRKHRRPRSTHM